MARKNFTNCSGWTRGEAWLSDFHYQTLNPPKKPEKPKAEAKPPLADVNYGPFTLTPVYRHKSFLAPRLLGWLIVHTDTKCYWPQAVFHKLPDARAFCLRIADDHVGHFSHTLRLTLTEEQRVAA